MEGMGRGRGRGRVFCMLVVLIDWKWNEGNVTLRSLYTLQALSVLYNLYSVDLRLDE